MTQSSRASARQPRTLLVVVLVLLVIAVVAAGIAVLVAMNRPSTEVAATAPASAPPSSPTSTAAPVATEPTVRVPATCDELLPAATAAALLGTDVELTGPSLSGTLAENPAAWADERAGVLRCTYAATADDPALARAVEFVVVPDATLDDVTATATGEPAGKPDPTLSATAFSSCSSGFGCLMWDEAGSYGVSFGVLDHGDASSATPEFVDAAVAFDRAVAALPAPDPLWQPVGPTLAGADSCDSIVDPSLLVDVLGASESLFKSDGGEYALSSLGTNQRVGSFWCSWTNDASAGVSAAVLPGGASFFEQVRGAAGSDWGAAPDLPGEAYLAAEGTSAQILIDSGWVRVTVTPDLVDRLPELVDSVLAEVGAS